jgi:hypothetical protein
MAGCSDLQERLQTLSQSAPSGLATTLYYYADLARQGPQNLCCTSRSPGSFGRRHAREMHAMRGTPMTCTPMRCTLTGCMPAINIRTRLGPLADVSYCRLSMRLLRGGAGCPVTSLITLGRCGMCIRWSENLNIPAGVF